MPDAISNTSPLLYLYRIEAIEWLPRLFNRIWVPSGVVEELREGQRRGFDGPDPRSYSWLEVIDPNATPSEWLSLDLGPGELAAMALALENRTHVVLLDDMLAGAYSVVDLTIEDYARCNDLLKRYADSDIGFVDAAVLAVVERLKEPKLATLDGRHFRLLRPRHIDALHLLPG